MKTQPTAAPLDRNRMVKVGDIPAGNVQLGHVKGSADPVLFPGGTVQEGRLALVFDGIDSADQALIDAAAQDSVVALGVDFKDEDDNVIYSVAAQGVPSAAVGDYNLPIAVELPKDLPVGIAEITVTDPTGLTNVSLAWIR